MSDDRNASSGGIGLFGVLFVVFLVLKLCNVIDWSWWWVTCPLWGPLALFGALMACVLVVLGIVAGFAAIVNGLRSSRP